MTIKADERRNKKRIPPADPVRTLLGDGPPALQERVLDAIHRRVYYLIVHFSPGNIFFSSHTKLLTLKVTGVS